MTIFFLYRVNFDGFFSRRTVIGGMYADQSPVMSELISLCVTFFLLFQEWDNSPS